MCVCVCTHHTFFIHSPTDGCACLCHSEDRRTRSLCVCVHTTCSLPTHPLRNMCIFVIERKGGQGHSVLCVCVCVCTQHTFFTHSPLRGCIYFVTERTGGQGHCTPLGCRDSHGKHLSLCWTPFNISSSPSRPANPTTKKGTGAETLRVSRAFMGISLLPPTQLVGFLDVPACCLSSLCLRVFESASQRLPWKSLRLETDSASELALTKPSNFQQHLYRRIITHPWPCPTRPNF